MKKIDWFKLNELAEKDEVSDEDLNNLTYQDIRLAEMMPSIREDLKPLFLKARDNLSAAILEKYGVVKNG